MKKLLIILAFLGLAGSAVFAFYAFNKFIYTQKQGSPEVAVSPSPEPLVGGDRDEHGCIPSAGYTWCEAKQKCLRTWEETCTAEIQETEIETLKTEIKAAIIAKRGQSAESLDITVSELSGNYAKGGASEAGLGGGMWFAAKVNGNWELVWDGNGIITCNDLVDYPDFPASMIPDCYNQTTQELEAR